MTPNEDIAIIKEGWFARFKTSRRLWIIEEHGSEFTVHQWSGDDAQYGPGVGPPSDYPTLRKAAARLLQLLGVGAVAPQTWPEDICVGVVDIDRAAT